MNGLTTQPLVGEGEGEHIMATPTSIFPHQGGDNTWEIPWFKGGQSDMVILLENLNIIEVLH